MVKSIPAMFFLCHDTVPTSLKPEWVDGSGDSNGDLSEVRVRLGPHVNVLLPAAILGEMGEYANVQRHRYADSSLRRLIDTVATSAICCPAADRRGSLQIGVQGHFSPFPSGSSCSYTF